MRAFGLIGTLISLAIVGYLVMSRTKSKPSTQAAKIEALKNEHGIELPAEALSGDLTKLPAAIKKDLEKKMKERTPD